MLVSHYDSATNRFGASDHGTAVADLLETARALKSSPALKGDLSYFARTEQKPVAWRKGLCRRTPWAKKSIVSV